MQQVIHESIKAHAKSTSLISLPIPELGPPVHRPRAYSLSDQVSLSRQQEINTSSPECPDSPELHIMTSSHSNTPKLHPSSFLLGLGIGIFLVLIKPAAQRVLVEGLSTLSTLIVALIVWGSIGGVAWFAVKTFLISSKKQDDETAIDKTATDGRSVSSGCSSRSTSSSPTRVSRRNSSRSVLSELDEQVSNMSYKHSRTPSPTKHEIYAYRPYGDTRQALQHPGTKTRKKHQDDHFKILSGDDLHIELEKPADQLAYRL